ncbi:hypothetical protein CAPTEDRAFT_114043 [Capitella teleta]|uniref:Major facilitator superfamily (MFS) profile domain-containing protein n=1 Tax=Capitella teleta TaxID=283909 RepID=R7U4X5_CAPTE|nr:hypothetical protein CAPTEDRAFT_114043 [Capitella teleta]|eukprot:ELU01171.1 hypothetical protein CAPTEDRAFT_114043 [Capitella teleta]
MLILTPTSQLADCMEIQVIGLLGPVLGFEWLLSSFQVSLISATVFLGTSIGAPMFGYIGDKYGRKTVLMLGAALTCFYGLLSAFSSHFIWILILRSLVGVGVAAQSQAVSYFSEFLPAKSRGRGVAFLAIAYSLGAILEACLAVLILDPYGWQLWLMVSALPMLVFLFFMSFFPESPRFLNTSGFNSKAMLTLRMVADENSTHLPKGMLKRDKKVNVLIYYLITFQILP